MALVQLAQHAKGLIGLSSCLKGEVATGIRTEKHPSAAVAIWVVVADEEVFVRSVDELTALVADLRERVGEIELGGGKGPRAKHAARGKLLPRERLALLLDPHALVRGDDVGAADLGRELLRVVEDPVEVGQMVGPERPLMAIVPLDQMWVNANFKEVNLRDIHIGQEVEMTSSIYGSKVKFTGTVLGISPGTGSVFSVLPPQNATGNWIQIVQRVPVKVSLDPKQLQEHPLRLGLSLDAKIHLKKSRGEGVKCHETPASTLKTTIFQEQMNGVESIINKVIQNNINSN